MRSGWDRVRHFLGFGMRPYRCMDCWSRFWAFPSSKGRGHATTAELPSTAREASLKPVAHESSLRPARG